MGSPKAIVIVFGESGGTSRFNECETLSQRDLVAERDAELSSVKKWVHT